MPNSMRGIHAVGDGRVAWASGTRGTVLRTVDGGAHWTKCAVPVGAEMLDFRAIQAFDERHAVVMSSGSGEASRLYKTSDGCMSWAPLASNMNPKGFWDALYVEKAPDIVSAWILGDPTDGHITLLRAASRTGNGFGVDNVVEHLPNDADKRLLEVSGDSVSAFAASNQALFYEPHAYEGCGKAHSPRRKACWHGTLSFVTGGTAGARVYRGVPDTGDCRGCMQQWVMQSIPVGSSSASSGAFAISLRDNDHGVIVGGDYTKPDDGSQSAVYTSNGSAWLQPQTMPHGYRSSVEYDFKHKAWITVGTNGTDVSTDDGKNWRALKPGPGDAPDADKKWNALSLPYVVGDRGRIGKLQDGSLR